MKRVLAVTAVVVVAVGGAAVAGSAIGQGTGGTLGEGAVGQLTVKLRFDGAKQKGGINPAKGNAKAKRPKVTDIHGGNGDVLDTSGKRIGRIHGVDVVTFQGAKRYKGGAESIGMTMLDLGEDNLLFWTCRTSDDERSNPCALSGGTGRYAGARGFVLEDFKAGQAESSKRFQIIPTTITFIP